MNSSTLEQFIGTKIGNVNKLGWFGFAADPPTLAHRAVIDATLGSGLIQKVIAFPAGNLPYKIFSASEWQRWNMTALWKRSAEWDDEVILSRFDLLRDQAILWAELWKSITRMAPQVKHSLIVGSDQYGSIGRHWVRGEELLNMANFIVVPRGGYPIEERLPENHEVLNISPIPGSSTAFRKGDLVQVDEMVRAYIIVNQLYQ